MFQSIPKHIARRAIASGLRKQKVQGALGNLGFTVERVDGGVEDARLRLALDALEFALRNSGARIHLFTHDVGASVLEERLRSHGADVALLSLESPLLSADATASPDRAAAVANGSDDDDDDEDFGLDDPDLDDDFEDDDDEDDEDDEGDELDAGGDGLDSDDDDLDDEHDRRRRRQREERLLPRRDEEERRGRKPHRHHREERRHERRHPKEDQDAAAKDPLELLSAAIASLVDGGSELLWATKVRQQMSALDTTFNELDHGYENLEGLLREAERRGRIVLQKDPRTSTFVIVAWRRAA